jgi:acyl-coenzyme A thioesterase PaaI-like protein
MLDLYWDTSKATATEMWQQKRRLARAMRLVIERLVPSNAPEDELRRAADGLEQYAERLKKHPRLKSAIGHAESANAGDVGAFFDQSPMIGLANPLSPPITVAKSGERSAVASVTFGSAYEGPPGAVHGGFVAAAFDEVLGFVQSLSSNPGFTGTLTVKYRSPAPLHACTPATCSAPRPRRSSSRPAPERSRISAKRAGSSRNASPSKRRGPGNALDLNGAGGRRPPAPFSGSDAAQKNFPRRRRSELPLLQESSSSSSSSMTTSSSSSSHSPA